MTTSASDAAIRAVNISVSLGWRNVLTDISCELARGTITMIVGPNGAGKTTLIRALNGTVPITGGEVRIDGENIEGVSRSEIARRIAVVAQENETKFPMTVREFVLSGRFAHGRAFGWESASDIQASDTALLECGLLKHSEALMNRLSGGERQRVVLARALAAETRVLLLDEPTANLDLSHQASMLRLVRLRCAERGVAAAIITHDLNLVSEFADRVLVLSNQRLRADGTPDEVVTTELIAEVFGISALIDKNPASGRLRVTTIF